MRSKLRFAVFVLLAIGGVTCTDGPSAPSRNGGPTLVRVAPEFSLGAMQTFRALGAFGVTVNNIHIHIDHPPAAPFDTVVAVTAGADSVALDLAVILNAPTEQLTIQIELRQGDEVLYSGTQTVTASVGATTTAPTATIPITYVGPGASLAHFAIAPHDTAILISGTVPFRVTATDKNGAAVVGVGVHWTVLNPALGSVDDASAVFTPSGAAGTTRVVAATLNGISDTATVVISAQPAALVLVSGGNQTGAAGVALPQPVVVRVQSASGGAVAGAVVQFAGTGGATVGAATVVSDIGGNAQTTVTLGTTVGVQSVTASLTGLSPLTISETATAGAATQLSRFSGDAQADTTLGTLKKPLVVLVSDAFGNPASGATVTWARLGGSGTLAAATSISNDSGYASMTYTLGATQGTDTIAATLGAVSGARVMFTAVAVKAMSIMLFSGNNQIGVVSNALPNPLVVVVTDDAHHVIPGATVTWSIVSGGGSLDQGTSVTNTEGLASTTLTLPTAAGQVEVRAEVANHAAVTFSVTAQTQPVGSLHFVVQPTNVQSATFISPPIQVEVLNAAGHRDTTSTAGITLAVLHGPAGGAVEDSLQSHGQTNHAVRGLATFYAGNDLAGTYKLIANSSGLSSDSSSAYVVSVGPASKITVVAGSTLTGSANDTTNIRPRIQVTDNGGNPIGGASVTWTVTQGNGTVQGADVATDPMSSFTISADSGGKSAVIWTLGGSSRQELWAKVVGGDSTMFTLTLPVQAYQLGFINEFSNSYASGSDMLLTVQLQDESGNPVAQAGVPIGVYLNDYGECGNLAPSRAPVASRAPLAGARRPSASRAPVVGARTPAARAGHNGTLKARSSAVSPPQRSSGCNRAPNRAPNRKLTANRGRTGGHALTGAQANRAPGGAARSIAVGGLPLHNAAPGVSGVWRDQPVPPDPTFIGDTVVLTDASGKAHFSNVTVAGYADEDFAIVAYDTTTDSPIWTADSPDLYLTPGAAYSILAEYDSTHQAAGRPIIDYPIAMVLDSVGNGVPYASMTLSIGAGGGSLDSSTVITDSWGEVDIAGWTLGSASGLNTIIATIDATPPHNSLALIAIAHQPGTLRASVPPLASIQDSTMFNPPVQISVTDSTGTWDLNVPGLPIKPAVLLSPTGQTASNPRLIGDSTIVPTAADGSVQFTGLGVYGDLGSTVALVFSTPGMKPDTTSLISIVAGSAARMDRLNGEAYDSIHVVGAATRQIQVFVSDTSGYGVGGATVNFSSTSSSPPYCPFANSSVEYSTTTDLHGIATATVLLPNTATSCAIQVTAMDAQSNMLSGAPIVFHETVVPAGYDMWTGASDSSWTNSANWSTGVPTSTTAVFIPYTTAGGEAQSHYPALSAPAAVGDLMVEHTARLELHNQALKVYGNLVRVGTGVDAWTQQGGGAGYVEMMTPNTTIATPVPYKLLIGDTGMACAGAAPIQVSGLDSATAIDINCPMAITASGNNWLTSQGDVNIQHHGTVTMSGESNWLYAEGNLNVTSDQSSEGLLTGGSIQVFKNFTQDTVAGAPASYKNFFSTGTSLLMENPSGTAPQTISATSNSLQFWTLSAANVYGASVSLSSSGATTYNVLSSLYINSGSGVESFTVPTGITLNAGGLSLGSTGRFYVNGTFNSTAACDSAQLAFIILGANGLITPPSCHP